MPNLLIISYDAVSDEAFDFLLQWPNFARLAKRACIARGVSSVNITNTYPVHTSVITGSIPAKHGIISNTEPFPKRAAQWCYRAAEIKARTLWQAAYEAGLSVGSVLWPVTGGAGEIRWNIPEIMVLPGQSQIVQNLKFGSKFLQLAVYLRYHKLMNGIHQPELDLFSSKCMAYILQKKRPNLALMHLTAYDSLCHEHGPDSPMMEKAFASLDESLGRLLDAMPSGSDVLLFSDHAQLAVHHSLLPNELLVELGYLGKDNLGNYISSDCFFECCGGSAFFHPGPLTEEETGKVKTLLEGAAGFGRFLSRCEMYDSGREMLPFGFCASPGWSCVAYPSGERGNHGYPASYEHYKVFYMGAGPSFAAGAEQTGGSLLELAPLAAAVLGVDMPGLGDPNVAFLRHGCMETDKSNIRRIWKNEKRSKS